MPIFAFYPNAEHIRRPDGIGFILAEGADANAARAVAQTLVGNPSISDFTAVVVSAGIEPVAVQGLPVGAKTGTNWPKLTRGGSPL